LMKKNLSLELETLQQVLYAYKVRLTWVKEPFRAGKSIHANRSNKRKICLDVLLPNPGNKESRLFVNFTANLKHGRKQVFLDREISVLPAKSISADWPRDVKLSRLDRQAPRYYTHGKEQEFKPGKTIRLLVENEKLLEQIDSVQAVVAFDPTGSQTPVIPDKDYGVDVDLYVSDDMELIRKSVLEESKSSLSVFRRLFHSKS